MIDRVLGQRQSSVYAEIAMTRIIWRVLLTIGCGLYALACVVLATETPSPAIRWALWAAASAHLIFGVEAAMRVRALARELKLRSEIRLIEAKPSLDQSEEHLSGGGNDPTDASGKKAA